VEKPPWQLKKNSFNSFELINKMNSILPRISIIIPCYNHGQYLREAINSVEDCSEKHLYEIIILNDGSTDNFTINILKQLTEEGYNVINQQNQGLGAARNNAIKTAKGEYILPLDSDNKIRSEYIYESIQVLDSQPEISIVYGDFDYFEDKTGEHEVGEFNLQKIMIGNYIDACAVYRKSAWETLSGYDENMPVMGMEDWDFWLNMSLAGYKFKYIPKILFDYRVLKNSMRTNLHSKNSVALEAYMQLKYKGYLNRKYINEELLSIGRKNKKLALKFFLAISFPELLNFLVKKKIIDNSDIF
jgi:glycosyltransferase involved in cell wall biosynthesis